MQGRTRLTTPPGEEPATDTSQSPERELYVRGFELPREPLVRSRHGRKVFVLASLILLIAVGYLVYSAASEGQFQDPALSDLLPGEGTEAESSVTSTAPEQGSPTPSPGQG